MEDNELLQDELNIPEEELYNGWLQFQHDYEEEENKKSSSSCGC